MLIEFAPYLHHPLFFLPPSPNMPLSMSLVTLWASFFAFAHAVDLFTALRDAGAAQFAQQIQADPSLVAIFTKPSVHTVFAPLDDAVNPNTTVFNRLLRRGNPPPGAVDTCDEQTTASNSASKRRSVDTDPFFPCVGNTCAPSWSSVSSTTPFWSSVSVSAPFWSSVTLSTPSWSSVSPSTSCSSSVSTSAPSGIVVDLDAPLGSVVLTNLLVDGGRKMPLVSHLKENSSGVELFSGLGNNVTIAQANIPYDHGRIHTLHGYLTNPESLMDTLAAKNLTSFASGIKSTNLTSVVSNPSPVGVTVFVPFNEAYNAGISPNASTSSLFTALSNHIVPNYLGLSPWLTNGTVLVTEAKTTLTVTIREGKYFINDAMIVAADLITTNGVAHVIDKVLATAPASMPTPTPYIGAADWSLTKPPSTAIMAGYMLASLLFVKWMT